MISAGNRDTISSNKGFSLLEMIVAITLVAMMAVGLWAVFSMSIRAWSRGTEFIDTNQRHRSILDLVRKQIASTYGLTPVDLQAEGILAPLFVGTGESLSFISLNSLQFQESPGLTLVSYEVVQNSGGSYALIEMEQPYLGTIPDLENTGSQAGRIAIFENLLGFTFEYFDPGSRDSPSRWVGEWDGQIERRLPQAVSMTMMSRDPRGNTLSRHMVIPIQTQTNNPRILNNPRVNRILGSVR
jgi:prepilin-type N-terminal cleavage/methylation domain-containing protein